MNCVCDHCLLCVVSFLPTACVETEEFAVSLHLVHIIFGLFGAIFILVSGFDTAGRTALTKGIAFCTTGS